MSAELEITSFYLTMKPRRGTAQSYTSCTHLQSRFRVADNKKSHFWGLFISHFSFSDSCWHEWVTLHAKLSLQCVQAAELGPQVRILQQQGAAMKHMHVSRFDQQRLWRRLQIFGPDIQYPQIKSTNITRIRRSHHWRKVRGHETDHWGQTIQF